MPKFEVVIEDSADKYDLFLESFDKHIKNSKLKKVTREGKLEWNLTAGRLSAKGVILIYQRRNDIVCRLIRDEDIGIRFVVTPVLQAYNGLPSKIYDEVMRALDEAYYEVIEAKEGTWEKISEKCIVCNGIIYKDQKVVKCAYCSSPAHRDHLLEYLKIKGRCPSCGKELKRYELV